MHSDEKKKPLQVTKFVTNENEIGFFIFTRRLRKLIKPKHTRVSVM